jgi:hypothetical protein
LRHYFQHTPLRQPARPAAAAASCQLAAAASADIAAIFARRIHAAEIFRRWLPPLAEAAMPPLFSLITYADIGCALMPPHAAGCIISLRFSIRFRYYFRYSLR